MSSDPSGVADQCKGILATANYTFFIFWLAFAPFTHSICLQDFWLQNVNGVDFHKQVFFTFVLSFTIKFKLNHRRRRAYWKLRIINIVFYKILTQLFWPKNLNFENYWSKQPFEYFMHGHRGSNFENYWSVWLVFGRPFSS